MELGGAYEQNPFFRVVIPQGQTKELAAPKSCREEKQNTDTQVLGPER